MDPVATSYTMSLHLMVGIDLPLPELGRLEVYAYAA